jgi:O-antigen/teichoic acid export membrane protein
LNSKWHLWTSLIKSGLRIIGCGLAIAFSIHISIILLALFLGIAEVLGIIEELGDKR